LHAISPAWRAAEIRAPVLLINAGSISEANRAEFFRKPVDFLDASIDAKRG
jgi:hypothetical protein